MSDPKVSHPPESDESTTDLGKVATSTSASVEGGTTENWERAPDIRHPELETWERAPEPSPKGVGLDKAYESDPIFYRNVLKWVGASFFMLCTGFIILALLEKKIPEGLIAITSTLAGGLVGIFFGRASKSG